MKRIGLLIAITALAVTAAGCQLAPKSFIKTMEPTWASVELRDDIGYDDAWGKVIDLLVKRFDLELLSREDGYARTNWLYTWTGELRENYRVRVIIKFTPDRKKVEVKSEAHYGGPGRWVVGSDTQLLQTLKTDIMGSVGRTTR